MRVTVPTGKYVVAVSGGVDSVALLDMLVKQPNLQLVVAHFDHGIRPDSADDATFVADLAKRYALEYVSQRMELGPNASEAVARQARYDFLHSVRERMDAEAIITAHHQDDLLETAILNILRGTGRRGLSSLKNTATVKRPLLQMSKNDISAYVTQQNLSWREDSTNHDERYTRNYIRHRLLVRFDSDARQQLLMILAKAQAVNAELDELLSELLRQHATEDGLDRRWFTSLPHKASREVMASWLRQADLADFDRSSIERLTVQAKTKPAGKRLDVLRGYQIVLGRQHLALEQPER